jgi:hypothetical protein
MPLGAAAVASLVVQLAAPRSPAAVILAIAGAYLLSLAAASLAVPAGRAWLHPARAR